MNGRLVDNRGKIRKGVWRDIYARDGNTCYECGKRMLMPDEIKPLINRIGYGNGELSRAVEYLRFTFGHIRSKASGGDGSLENIAGEHRWCNKEKKHFSKLGEEKREWMQGYADKYVPVLLGYLEK